MKTVGVIGAGSMGSGIAQIAASNGFNVVLYDNNPSALEKAIDKLNKILNRLVEKGRIDVEKKNSIISLIQTTNSLSDFQDANIVIEAIVENMEVKKKVFSELNSICSKSAILATNTSSLSITAIASSCDISERVIGIHFFNPARNIHRYNIRLFSRMTYVILKARKKLWNLQHKLSCDKVWNDVSDDIKLLSLRRFRKKFKSILIAKY